MKPIIILGEGAWGTAIATLLAHNGYDVLLWCYHAEIADEINSSHQNSRYLPDIMLDEKIKATSDIQKAITSGQWIFEAIPVKYLRSICQRAKPFINQQHIWVVLSKGIENKTLLFPSEIIKEVFDMAVPIAVFAGPSFAHDVATRSITAVTIAAINCDIATQLQKKLTNDFFRPYTSTDVIGVQVGAALKNVITLAIGMLDGAGYSDNAKAFIFTRGLAEMGLLTRVLGGKEETVYGLSGIGDLVLTSMGEQSRNRRVGKLLGKGESLDHILTSTGYIPEGINTVQSLYDLMKQHHVVLPICVGMYEIIFKQKLLSDFLKEFMARPLDWECAL